MAVQALGPDSRPEDAADRSEGYLLGEDCLPEEECGPVLVALGDEPAETSGVTTSLILGFVRARGGETAVRRVLDRAGVQAKSAELEDPSRWISYATRIRLFQAAVDVLEDPDCTYAMGFDALRLGLHHGVVLLLKALGSPNTVYRQLPRSVAKFSTTSTMRVLESGAGHVTLWYKLHEGYEHSRLDCAYAKGLITVVPEIFGLAPATLEHVECESDGYDACIYTLRWSTRRRWWDAKRRADQVDPELIALRGQLQELQSAATDLVSTEDIVTLLDRITERAAATVLAPAHLLALHGRDGREPAVRSRGLTADTAQRMAAALLAGQDVGPEAVVAEVASSRQVHGYLAAVYPPGQVGPLHEHPMLRAYAGHVAAALDLVNALDRSQQETQQARALLALAHDLRSTTDSAQVAAAVAPLVPQIVSASSAAFYQWDQKTGQLEALASVGQDDAGADAVLTTALEPATCRELAALLGRREPLWLLPDTDAGPVRKLIQHLCLARVLVMPLLAGDKLLGVLTAGWRDVCLEDPDEAVRRLQGVADYAATALENARLLSTVRHQAQHDALTQLPNRATFQARLEQAAGCACDGEEVAVLFCDLDGFKDVNDRLGHAAGDELLRQVAGRLSTLAETGTTVARLAGDEFAVLLEHATDRAVASELGWRLVTALAAPYRVEGMDLRVTASVGVAHLRPGGSAEELLRSADSAMYLAKQRGRNQVAEADSTALPAAPDRLAFHRELRAAVANGELRLYFQRIVRLGANLGSVESPPTAGVEALLRWQHPRLGLLGPAAFLPLAEQTGLVVDLDLWALREACGLVDAWQSAPEAPIHVAVNLSADTLRDERLLPTVRQSLLASGLEPQRLFVEVVESRSLLAVADVTERLRALRQLGVRVSLDDFGTGYSTLSWLQRLPVDQVKLDRTFTSGITSDVTSRALAEGVLALADRMGLDIVAEGVESAAEATLLRDMGFPLAQGFLWHRPEAAAGGPGGGVVGQVRSAGGSAPAAHTR